MNVAIITGASSGMGKLFACQVTNEERFDELWVIARSKQKLEQLKKDISCPVRVLSMDLTDSKSLAHYQALLAAEHPNVRLLANCSGFGKFGSWEEIPLSDSLNMIDLNVRASVAMTELTLPYMQTGAKLVQWVSVSAFQPVPYLNIYAASKAFLLSYTRALALELRPKGIRTMAVCPYWVKTPFFERAMQTGSQAVTQFQRMYPAQNVVKTAIHDLYHTKKDVSVHGAAMKLQRLAVKLLPHRLVMQIWLYQQRKR